ncbi:MAG: acylneuraminate cytidylyltransferase family protein [Candidatus Omnitrophica bacterium]|nr:acylneuraminate cytidylyltransferase family protein [Candidatus Omnitrophota bacterium]MDD5352419.1 acylneuraminate cytidylyltransferase family protein [Candidatus Omnitrophota bacterium]MDD5550017.1 acylneuraminate cytidylyltransferase family protein [Candidatus Omnitrophota bacterium]
MKILGTIAARGGSKSVKNKNIRNLLGKPLIAYTIEQMIKWGKYEKFIVSTDSKKIIDIALFYGAEVPFVRPKRLAGDKTGKLEALRHALKESEKFYKIRFDALLDIDATSPIRTVNDIEGVVNLFIKNNVDCVFSVVKSRRNPYFNMIEKDKEGVKLCKQRPKIILRRQDAPLVYDMNSSIYIYKREFLLEEKNRMPYSKKFLIYEMPSLSGVDIDSELDFKFIEFLVKEGVVKL